MVQRAQMKLWARAEGEIPKCPLCREEFPDQDGDTQEMLDLASPGASQETEDSPSPGALTLSLSLVIMCWNLFLILCCVDAAADDADAAADDAAADGADSLSVFC